MKLKNVFLIFASLIALSSCNIFDVTSKELTFLTYRRSIGYKDLPSSNNPKVLVIPVVFSDCSLSSEQLEIEHDNIVKTFKGKTEDTYWESVSSFYQKSSYNNLNLDITVSDYCYLDYSIIEASQFHKEYRVEPTYKIIEDASSWYNKNYSDFNSFDTNNDNAIDSIWLVYMEDFYTSFFDKNPDYKDDSNLRQFLWAYTYWYMGRWKLETKAPFCYSWASYKFMHQGKNSNGTDAHTFIHETGHLLGLEDYYNYDYSTSLIGDRTKPCGSLDMMDNNVLDHNAYSKYLLGWISPEIASDGTYTLDAFQNDGDALIIKTSNNNSPLDEYLIIEYYTPTGLNELDSNVNYAGYKSGFKESGFKIYHIDSRLGIYTYKNHNMIFERYYEDYSTFAFDSRENYITIAHSNTPSRSAFKNCKLVSLLSPLGRSRLYFSGSINQTAEEKDLFQTGDKLDTFKFNSYQDDDLLIEIIDSNETNGTLKISGVGK